MVTAKLLIFTAVLFCSTKEGDNDYICVPASKSGSKFPVSRCEYSKKEGNGYYCVGDSNSGPKFPLKTCEHLQEGYKNDNKR